MKWNVMKLLTTAPLFLVSYKPKTVGHLNTFDRQIKEINQSVNVASCTLINKDLSISGPTTVPPSQMDIQISFDIIHMEAKIQNICIISGRRIVYFC